MIHARVPLSPAEHAELLGAADGEPLAEYLRDSALARARGLTAPPPLPAPDTAGA